MLFNPTSAPHCSKSPKIKRTAWQKYVKKATLWCFSRPSNWSDTWEDFYSEEVSSDQDTRFIPMIWMMVLFGAPQQISMALRVQSISVTFSLVPIILILFISIHVLFPETSTTNSQFLREWEKKNTRICPLIWISTKTKWNPFWDDTQTPTKFWGKGQIVFV